MKLAFAIDAIFPPLTGIGRYAFELATRLARHEGLDEVRFLGMWNWTRIHAGAAASQVHMAELAPPPWLAYLRRQMAKRIWAVEAYDAVSDRWRGHLLKQARHAVYHSPNYFLAPHDGPSVATVHDLSITRYPETHPPARRRYVELAFERSLARANGLITDTEAVRQELIADYSVTPDKVRAIPLGVDEMFRPMQREHTESVLRAHGLAHGGYTLAVATLEPRKKLDKLMAAYAELPDVLRRAVPLVLVGASGWLNSPLQTRMAQAQAQGWLRFLGYVPQAELPALYAGAHGFAMPSMYEGFGLPVLEAMASGVPVLTSSLSCLPEVAAGAALLVHPDDVDGMRLALHRLLTDEVWREKAVALGLARASELTWERCVDQTIEVYRSLNASC